MKIKIEDIKKIEMERANALALILVEKPTLSPMMLVLPFLVLIYLQQLKKYREKIEIFKKEYLFTRRMAWTILQENYPQVAENWDEIYENKIVKKSSIKGIEALYESQLEEIKMHYEKYLLFLKGENIQHVEKLTKEKEIKTLKIAREIFCKDKETLEFSLKLEVECSKKDCIYRI